MSTNPFLSFFPALPLAKTLHLGDWCIGTPGADVPWRSARFKELVHAHVASFAKEGFKDGAWMWHHARGFDGSMPEPEVWAALRATMCFVALDVNDHVRDDPNAGHYFATSENAELYTQPIDEEKAYITHQEGGLLKHVLSSGWKIGEEMVSLPDAVVALLAPVLPSQRLASAVFNALCDPSKPINRRIGIALEWHRFALSNPRVVSWEQRLISLKTGFEALSGQSKTHLCGQFLRKLFEDTTRPHVQILPWAGLLWSPNERTDLARFWMKNGVPQPVVRSELEDWFAAFGEQRNAIIHEGTLSSHVYEAPPERPLSRYAGLLFWTADRLLRETVKALLGVDVLLCGRLRDLATAEKLAAVWDEVAKAEAQEPESVAVVSSTNTSPPISHDREPASAGSTRDLATLLAELGCDAANKVQLEKVVPQPSSTIESAEENERAARGWWGAIFEQRSMLINRAEKDLLEAAGAEFPLPQHWRRCE